MTTSRETVAYSTILDAPVDRVWAIMRDFNDWPRWLSVLESSEIEGGLPGDAVGAIRVLRANGDTPREQLLALDDQHHIIKYALLEAAWPPISDYVATIKLFPVTDGDRTYAEWTATYRVDPSAAAEVADALVGMVYRGGLAGVRALLGS
ncbi:unannotated protein [freshwater metagenome]|uniref:Unannotated protein n=1 Tax=freshwater metagenome TaxID=449393 RepID=A0A6J7I1S0_9ZZZZ|nr:SRPBCC family protein [Actinomycetota bacterium]